MLPSGVNPGFSQDLAVDCRKRSIERPSSRRCSWQVRAFSRSRETLDVLPRRGHVDPGCRQYGQSQNHRTSRQIRSHFRRPGRTRPALGRAPRPASPRGSRPGAACSHHQTGQPREAGKPRTGRHAGPDDAGSAFPPQKQCQGDRHRHHQSATDNHNSAIDQRSAQRKRGYGKHPERIEYAGEYQPVFGRTGRVANHVA